MAQTALWGTVAANAAAASLPQESYSPDSGAHLVQHTCPHAKKVWLCPEGQDEFFCWLIDHPDYRHPTIGVSQAEADSLAATEIARRAALDADLHRARAHDAEMPATALALSAADNAEADKTAKENAAAETAKTAQAVRDSYEVAKALANADASH